MGERHEEAEPEAGRVVLVTGGTSGIGAGLVAAFLAVGDRVYTCGRRADRVERLRADQAEGPGTLAVLVGDVTDDTFRHALTERIGADCGRLDVLVNNAGIIRGPGDLEETIEDWRATLETNLIAPFAFIQACAPLLCQAADPCVINIGSACAQQAFETCTSTSYSVSKAGLDMLTLRLARALGPQGIRVNAVAPGVVPSEMWGEGAEALIESTIGRRHCLQHRPVTPDDVARAVLFLASSDARTITGTILKVDAGYTLG
jgi:NAD(P)-dependent dehydrogenase (short-subunit alcohol dehydrogenase family)